MRYFNTFGPIDPQKHYFVPRTTLINELLAQIDAGHYFTLFAPRQMVTILSHFRQFVERRGREAFKVTTMPQEATGQYLLSAYLDILMRQVGSETFVEVPSGSGRLDLIVVYQGQRYVVETKIWRGKAEFDKGLQQLADYLETENVEVGYFVVFHALPNVYGKLPGDQLEFTQILAGKTIHVYLVRIGEFVDVVNTSPESC